MTQSGVETEVKIRIADLSGVLSRLHALGYTTSVDRLFEANTLYDKPEQDLRERGMLLRLRQAGDKKVITWKGVGQAGPHKSRPEVETSVGSLEAVAKILEQLGFFPQFRYEKYRTELTSAGSDEGTVTVDETPIGNFIELEGPADWIDSTARELGFEAADYILDSYGKLYLTDCERRGVGPTNMVFAS